MEIEDLYDPILMVKKPAVSLIKNEWLLSSTKK
jgi:hypothetical protein